MPKHVIADPFRRIPEARVAAIIRDYRNDTLTVDEVTRRHRIGTGRLNAILDARKVPRRGRRPYGKSKAPKGAKAPQPADGRDDALEHAKRFLRSRGMVVYDASVSEGARGKGLVRVDNRRLTRDEVIALVAKLASRLEK